MADELPDTIPQLRAAARRTGGYSRSVPHAEVREAVVHIDEQAKEIAALREEIADLRRQLAEEQEWVANGITVCDSYAAENQRLFDRAETLKAALEPFGCACGNGWCHVIEGEMSKNPDCARLRARAALAGKE